MQFMSTSLYALMFMCYSVDSRQCDECWECYACTHDDHYGLTGNCVPITGCEPSVCGSDDECGQGRSCVSGNCQECGSSADCSDFQDCYYGQCRDPCDMASDCTEYASGDLCENGFCVCSGSDCARSIRLNVDSARSEVQLKEIIQGLGQNPTEDEIAELVQEIDTDGDGQIDFDEFLAMLTRNVNLNEMDIDIDIDIEKARNVFDKTIRGEIGADELREIMSGLGQDLSDEQLSILIQRIKEIASDSARSNVEEVPLPSADLINEEAVETRANDNDNERAMAMAMSAALNEKQKTVQVSGTVAVMAALMLVLVAANVVCLCHSHCGVGAANKAQYRKVVQIGSDDECRDFENMKEIRV